MRRLLLGLVMLAVVAPAVADLDVEKLVDDLGGEDAQLRSAALTALRSAKDPRAIPRILDRLPGFGLYGQYYGVMVLESYPPKTVKRTLPRVLAMDAPYLRVAAGVGLHRLGDDRGVPAVVEGLRAQGLDTLTRSYMLNRLYGVQEPRILEVLYGMLEPGIETNHLGSILWILQSRENPKAIAACRRLFERAERTDVRFLTATFLYRFGDEERSKDLAAALRSGEVTYSAFSRMKSMLQTSRRRLADEILDALVELLKNEDANTSLLRYVIEFLGDRGHRKATTAIRKLLDHENRFVSEAAFEALVELGDEFDCETLRPMLEHDDAERRLAVAELLRRMDDLSGLPVVIGILQNGERLRRSDAARLLGTFPLRAAVDPLLDALLDADVSVRTSALYGLDQLWRTLFPYRRFDLVAAGYTAAAPEAERKAAVARIRAWWEAHRHGDW